MDTKITNKKNQKSLFNTVLPFLIDIKKTSSINMQSCKTQYKKLEVLKQKISILSTKLASFITIQRT